MKMMKQVVAGSLVVSMLAVACVAAQDKPARQDPNQLAQSLAEKGLAFLKSKQKPDGAFHTDPEPPAITALVLRAFAQNPQADDETMKKGVERLLSYQKPDGGIYADTNANY